MNDTQPSFLHGDKVCRPADWIDVVKFFGFNFALHATTVVAQPGDTIFRTTIISLGAVLIPLSGLGSAMAVLLRLVFLFGGGELGKALSANTLCMLMPARCALGPRSGVYGVSPIITGQEDPVESLAEIPMRVFDPGDLEEVNLLTTVVHGQYTADIRRLYIGIPSLDEPTRAKERALGLEYTLVAVPITFSVVPLLDTHSKHASPLRMLRDRVKGIEGAGGGPVPLKLSCNYSFLKTSAALIQILYGSYELHMISDDQIRLYGYAA